jgi:hypothetical protein
VKAIFWIREEVQGQGELFVRDGIDGWNAGDVLANRHE